jgi:hypothetical protein
VRILGIDPGLQTTGFGVLDVDGPQLHYVASGTITTHHLPRGDLPARLKVLFDGICEALADTVLDVARPGGEVQMARLVSEILMTHVQRKLCAGRC